jgi:hypothetical protein
LAFLDTGEAEVLVSAQEIGELTDRGGVAGDGSVEIPKFELEVGESEVEGGGFCSSSEILGSRSERTP